MMMRRFRKKLLRRLRNSERGQSIVLLAIGFLALASFVGLVTDVSIMFVRFATLRRAVDSAAVAAAGQIREGTNYSTVALTARQYVALHGLEPHRVWVETCETEIAEWRESNPPSGDAGIIAAHPEWSTWTTEQRDELAVLDFMNADTSFEMELCDPVNPRKLVRVVAQIDSETTFLQLIGIDDFVITASATSETAALDIALVLDNSTSMAFDTQLVNYTNAALGAGQNGLGMSVPGSPNNADQLGNGSSNVRGYCAYNDGSINDRHQWGGCCNDPGYNARVALDEATGRWFVYTDGVIANVSSMTDIDSDGVLDVPAGGYASEPNGIYDAGSDPLGVAYNHPDGFYDDLACMPFRQVKDAARNFIQRLDFVRGDRVGIVTFNSRANIIYPNLGAINEDDLAPGEALPPPMMVSEEDAVRTLDRYVGVYVRPSGEARQCSAQNRGFFDVRDRWADPTQAGLSSNDTTLANDLRPYAYDTIAQCQSTNVGDGLRFANALLTDPSTIRRDAVWVAILLSDGAANSSYFIRPDRVWGAPNDDETSRYGDFGFCPWYTFCLERSPDHPLHRGPGPDVGNPNDVGPPGNVNNALWFDGLIRENYDTGGNLTGTVSQEDGQVQWWETFPYWQGIGYGDGSSVDIDWSGLTGGSAPPPYPSFLECVNSYNNTTAANTQYQPTDYLDKLTTTACNDNNEDTRHFCIVWSNDPDRNGLPPDLDNLSSDCGEAGRYDADDYARDMADWAGLAILDQSQNVPGNFIALFTIGFGDMTPDSSTDGNRTAAPLLRYIADAGDNGIIDNNLQQDWRQHGPSTGQLRYGFNGNANGGYPSEYGAEDPCTAPAFQADPELWCGQYYYASDIDSLDEVFEAIAGRLFTRIAR